jgi:hypothetical protein
MRSGLVMGLGPTCARQSWYVAVHATRDTHVIVVNVEGSMLHMPVEMPKWQDTRAIPIPRLIKVELRRLAMCSKDLKSIVR